MCIPSKLFYYHLVRWTGCSATCVSSGSTLSALVSSRTWSRRNSAAGNSLSLSLTFSVFVCLWLCLSLSLTLSVFVFDFFRLCLCFCLWLFPSLSLTFSVSVSVFTSTFKLHTVEQEFCCRTFCQFGLRNFLPLICINLAPSLYVCLYMNMYHFSCVFVFLYQSYWTGIAKPPQLHRTQTAGSFWSSTGDTRVVFPSHPSLLGPWGSVIMGDLQKFLGLRTRALDRINLGHLIILFMEGEIW